MKKKILAITIGVSLLLSGCLGGDDGDSANSKAAEGFHFYTEEDFRIQVADEWETLTPLNFKSDTPKNTVIAFRSNMRNPKFTPNVIILKNELSQDVSSSDYAKAQYQKITSDLTAYREIQVEKTTIRIGGKDAETLFIHVEGRQASDADLKRFIQISGVRGKTAFIAIGSALAASDEGTLKKIETIVRSFEVQ